MAQEPGGAAARPARPAPPHGLDPAWLTATFSAARGTAPPPPARPPAPRCGPGWCGRGSRWLRPGSRGRWRERSSCGQTWWTSTQSRRGSRPAGGWWCRGGGAGGGTGVVVQGVVQRVGVVAGVGGWAGQPVSMQVAGGGGATLAALAALPALAVLAALPCWLCCRLPLLAARAPWCRLARPWCASPGRSPRSGPPAARSGGRRSGR